MANFESGVADYIKAYAVIEVAFPIDFKGNAEKCCKHCPYLSSNERTCQLNKKPIAYPKTHVGDDCPLIPIEKEE